MTRIPMIVAVVLPLVGDALHGREGRSQVSFRAISTGNAEHYTWGANCDGWFLLKGEQVHVIQERMPAETAEVMHFHARSRQLFYVLRGELTMRNGSSSVRMVAGQAVVIEANTKHRASNESKAPVEFLVISSPPSHGDRIEVG